MSELLRTCAHWQAGKLASWLSALRVDFMSFHPTVSIFCTPQSVCLSLCLFVCLSRCHASFFLEACHLKVEKGWHSGRRPPLYDSAASWPSKHDSSSSSLPFPHLEALLVSFKRETPNAQHHPPKGTEWFTNEQYSSMPNIIVTIFIPRSAWMHLYPNWRRGKTGIFLISLWITLAQSVCLSSFVFWQWCNTFQRVLKIELILS